jgi:hypothetical protein
MRRRRDHFLSLYDFSVGHGLEIGPLDAGIADPAISDVSYVDVFDREGIQQHYERDQNVILELIPQIDYPLHQDGTIRTLVDAAGPGAPYDWVIASHVIEHVPDLIGWLKQVAQLTADAGALILAVPDRRYCFDRHRPPTTTGQAIEAYEAGHTRPSIRAVYDYFSSAVTVDTARLSAGERPPGRSAHMHDPATISAMMDRCRAGEYVDCHVWTFTPDSFVDQVRELRALGLCDWYVEKLLPVEGGLEFHVVLRRLPRGGRGHLDDLPEPASVADMPDWLFEEWRARDEIQRQRRRIRRLRRQKRQLERRVDEVTGSTRWAVGAAVLAPARAIRRVIRRGARGDSRSR